MVSIVTVNDHRLALSTRKELVSWLRRIVAHCFGVLLYQQNGLPPLQFSELVNA